MLFFRSLLWFYQVLKKFAFSLFFQEMSYWVPYSSAWPLISPSIPSPCALLPCCILCRFVVYEWKQIFHCFKCFIFSLLSLFFCLFLCLFVSVPSSIIAGIYPPPCLCSSSVSTSQWISAGSASGGSSCSISSCTSAACLSSSVSPFSCSAPGTTCPPSTASCE